jgi:hypothetical protein
MQTFKITVQDDNFAIHLLQLFKNMNFVTVELANEDEEIEDMFLASLVEEAKDDVFLDWEEVKRELRGK